MRDFYAHSARWPLDQADGLRRLFAGRRCYVLPLAANPHVACSGVVLDRLATALAAHGHEVLVVDAGATSPPPHELADVDLGACVETLAPHVSYLAARGLPLAHVDTRGCAGGFIDAVQDAAPQATAILMHAQSGDLARLFKRQSVRPVLLGADHPESIKHAYADAKLLARRCGLFSFDLLLAANARSPRVPAIVASLGSCVENFLGAVLRGWALVDPALDAAAPAEAGLTALLTAQMALQDGAGAGGAASSKTGTLKPDFRSAGAAVTATSPTRPVHS